MTTNYTTPRSAPYPVGTRLECVQDPGTTVNGETVYFQYNGAQGVIVEVTNECYMFTDEWTGERYPVHGWSTLQYDEDTDGVFKRCIDVEDTDRYRVLEP